MGGSWPPAHGADGGRGVARLTPLTLEGPAGSLEALFQVREPEQHRLVALVCHPHSLYGGTMHNKVVHRVASVLTERGAGVLRFNFRGAGKSAGSYDQGEGELADARRALAWLRDHSPAAERWVAGFSFGSWIAARLAASEPDIARLILVAPPVTRSGFDVLRECAVPKLVIQGTRDDICPLAALEAEYPSWAEPKALIRVEGATHFFDRQLGELGVALERGLPLVAGGPHSEVT